MNVVAQRVAPVCSLVAPTIVASCTGGSVTVTGDGSRSYSGNLDNTPLSYHWTGSQGRRVMNSTGSSPNRLKA